MIAALFERAPFSYVAFLHRTRYIHYFIVGATGVGINLVITVSLTELLFGREHYYSAYLIGLGANLLYSFALHTFVTFKTSRNHALRLLVFVGYSLVLAYVQASTVRTITDWVGVDWYAPIIASVILTFSAISFVFFKLFLFREKPSSGKVAENITTHG